MKIGLALMTLLMPLLAWTQGVGGGGSSGGGLRLRTLGCIEGNKGLFVRQSPNSGKEVTELRTCRSGSFMTNEERESYIRSPKTSCQEGAYLVAREHVYEAGKELKVLRACRNNKWVIERAE